MPPIAKPADYTTASELNHTTFNALKNPVYDLVNGDLDDQNIAAGAGIQPSKIANTAYTLGGSSEQALTCPTRLQARTQFKEAELAGWSFDEDDTEAININGVTTFALVAGKGVYLVSITGVETLTTITGGQEGDVIYILWQATDASLTVTHTAAQDVNTLSLRGRATETWTTVGGKFITRFRFSAIGGTGKWYEC